MATKEFFHILAAVIILTAVSSFTFILKKDFYMLGAIFLFSVIIIGIHVISKKLVAYALDANAEHSIWSVSRYGFKPTQYFKKSVPAGIMAPVFFTIFSLGLIKPLAILTYETQALKVRAAKRFGFYSYTEMTDWHNGLIGAVGIVAVLLISFISYFGFEDMARMAAFYAFWNMIPISNLDGTQIFFGSRVLWATLGVITVIFTAYALLLPI